MQKAAVGKKRVHWASAKLDTCNGWKQTELLIPSRCSAAPFQATLAKPKPVKETKRPRLNNEITDKFMCSRAESSPSCSSIFRSSIGATIQNKQDFFRAEACLQLVASDRPGSIIVEEQDELEPGQLFFL